MSSPLTKTRCPRRDHVLCGLGAVLLACAALTAIVGAGCRGGVRDAAPGTSVGVYPSSPRIPRVLALGNLRGAPPPSRTKIKLTQFFFGADPPSPLTLLSPTGLATDGESVLVCDAALNTVLCWDPVSGVPSSACERSRFDYPFALDIGPSGDRFVCDRGGATRRDADGALLCSFEMEGEDFKPADVMVVDDTVLISNRAAHRIEVFDAISGRRLRGIGEPGRGPGQLNMPRGLAHDSAGAVYVVDVLNNRVQVFDRDYKWVRDIGRPGNGVGSLGRPRDVAVGPDGTVFVTDAFSQRVHAFDSRGKPLLAFGGAGSGIGELTMPNGVTITTLAPQADRALPPDVSPEYYVLVAEQLNRPGVRVYAWLAKHRRDFDVQSSPYAATMTAPRDEVSAHAGPHWDPESCEACHDTDDDIPLPIDPDDINDLCGSCHDGHDDLVWAHPVDGILSGPGLQTPADWPLPHGRLGCLSCHDVTSHCDRGAQRPSLNRAMLREYNPDRRLAFCGNCHVETIGWSGSPHGQLDGQGRLNHQSCLFCHRERPAVSPDGRREFDAKLRDASGSCLNCHDRHWDYYPAEHSGKSVSAAIRRRMLTRELSDRADPTDAEIRELAAQATRRPAKLPLNDGSIACYTCHNPHHVGLFPPGSVLGTAADSPIEAAYKLRIGRPELCQECHGK